MQGFAVDVTCKSQHVCDIGFTFTTTAMANEKVTCAGGSPGLDR